ncbi:hypothetical protein LguiA_029650 [Lonicera macranthoides]
MGASSSFSPGKKFCKCIWQPSKMIHFLWKVMLKYRETEKGIILWKLENFGISPCAQGSSSPFPSRWSCLSCRRLKVNCDAAAACIIRDSNGSLIHGFSKVIAPSSSVLVAEAIAVKETCILCIKAGIKKACTKSDNSLVVSWCIEEDGIPPGEVRTVIEDIRQLASRASLSFFVVVNQQMSHKGFFNTVHWLA